MLESVSQMLALFIILLASVASNGLSPDHSDYEALDSSEPKSQSLTKELLSLDLGYNVLNSEVLSKSLGVNFGQTPAQDRVETLPQAEPLIENKNYQVTSWSGNNDDKLWGGGGPSPFFFPDFGFTRARPVPASVVRPYRRPFHPPPQTSAPKTFVGDQHQCATGSCEFFLFCWLGGGLIEGSCGGFLFACCQRPDGGRNSEVIVEKVSFFWTTPPFVSADASADFSAVFSWFEKISCCKVASADMFFRV